MKKFLAVFFVLIGLTVLVAPGIHDLLALETHCESTADCSDNSNEDCHRCHITHLAVIFSETPTPTLLFDTQKFHFMNSHLFYSFSSQLFRPPII